MGTNEDRPLMSVMLAVADAPAAVAWYERALDATVLWSRGSVAGLAIAGVPFFVGQPEGNGWETPGRLGATSTRIEVFCDDPDGFVARAVGAGANGRLDPVRNHEAPWGIHRQGGFVDPFGHVWLVGDRSPLAARGSERSEPQSTGGVTVKLLTTVDLGPEIEGMAGRQLRMRMVTIEPGGVFGPVHDHKGRPGTVYILKGTITDHRDGVATDYGPGVGWPEDRNTTHWLENRGTIPAVEISVDIVRQD